ncbi:rRNA adenine methyltransferase [Herbaspirillum frisingense]|uniref:class II aldolase/adducin family protein n=1 Tax=Herbaspirillum frisingense TaxID=92645 RepID=UPI0016046311|nr:class II aldolase/adducin family protein [Herbaspirillum frisingense]QNB06700.1 rRNA adenine methyltransferase [Herbaspirillum frisingense]
MTTPDSTQASQAQAVREDLAAAHRLAVWHDLTEGIYNHLTAAVPGHDDRFYVPPFGLHWSEVKASELLTVDFDGRILDGEGILQRSAYCIHAPIHAAHPRHAVILHTHMAYTSALVRLEDQRLHPLGQTEALLIDQIAYDEHYDGLAREPAEGERLAAILGEKTILFMASHGVLVTGRTVAEAYDRLYSLERYARVHLHALWTGRPTRSLTPAQVAKVQDQIRNTALHSGRASHDKPAYQLHFEALRRLLDKREPDYTS